MTDRQNTVTILRTVADLLEANPDLPAPYLSFQFDLKADRGYDAAEMAALIAAAFPGLPWKTRTTTGDRGNDLTWLEGRQVFPHSVAISAPADAFGTQAGQRVVTEWEPLPAIAAILADRQDDADE